MKFFAPLFTALILSACTPDPTPLPMPTSRAEQTPDAVHFIQLCSGVTLTDSSSTDEGLVAVSNCLGRIRGYADGVALSAELYKTPKLWCIPSQQRDQDVMAAVLHWVDRNPDRYKQFVDMFDSRSAASATIILALRESFSCRST